MMRETLPPLAQNTKNSPPNSLKWLTTSNYVGRSALEREPPEIMHVSEGRRTRAGTFGDRFISDIPPAPCSVRLGKAAGAGPVWPAWPPGQAT
jgi:hypothetical protein